MQFAFNICLFSINICLFAPTPFQLTASKGTGSRFGVEAVVEKVYSEEAYRETLIKFFFIDHLYIYIYIYIYIESKKTLS